VHFLWCLYHLNDFFLFSAELLQGTGQRDEEPPAPHSLPAGGPAGMTFPASPEQPKSMLKIWFLINTVLITGTEMRQSGNNRKTPNFTSHSIYKTYNCYKSTELNNTAFGK
jgi:hypothetical protein